MCIGGLLNYKYSPTGTVQKGEIFITHIKNIECPPLYTCMDLTQKLRRITNPAVVVVSYVSSFADCS